MGAYLARQKTEAVARQKSETIDRMLEAEKREKKRSPKILLLGTGESGKSTLVKQMKIIRDGGFTEAELDSFAPTIIDDLIQSMKRVLTGMALLRIDLEDPKNECHVQTLLSCQGPCDDGIHKNLVKMPPAVAAALQSLWKDKGIRLCASRGFEYKLNDSAAYYFENMERLCSENYRATASDVLRPRDRTAGIVETRFDVKNYHYQLSFRMVDVGDRMKWIQYFYEGFYVWERTVAGLIFVTALSDYDTTLDEDVSKNRLNESLLMFQWIVDNPYFERGKLILFLNKTDLFRDKIQFSGRHLRNYFPDYRGPDRDVESAKEYILNLFVAKIRDQDQRWTCKFSSSHFTCATDTSNIKFVFQSVGDFIAQFPISWNGWNWEVL